MKKCFKCGESKPLNDFYKHPEMSDGRVNKCKECNKKDVRENRSLKIEQYRRYDQMRFQTQPHRAQANKKYAQTPEGREVLRLARLAWQSREPEKRAAHIILGNAVRNARVVKPEACIRCGKIPPKKLLHGHHHDYAKPLEVEWLCVWCHASEHFPNEFRR